MIRGMSKDQLSKELNLHELEDAVSKDINLFLNEPVNEELHKMFDIVPNCEVNALEKSEHDVSAAKQKDCSSKCWKIDLLKIDLMSYDLTT